MWPFVEDPKGRNNHGPDWNRESMHSNGHFNGNGTQVAGSGHVETALDVLERAGSR